MCDFEPIIVDNGTWSIKSGFSDDSQPQSITRSIIGRPHASTSQLALQDLKSSYIGSEAQDKREVLALQYPIERGLISNWDDMETLWRYTFHHDLRVNQNDHPVLLSESPSNTKYNQKKMAEIMFEQFNVPRLSILNQSLLSLYGSGRTTGIVVDAGHGSTHTVAISEGAILQHATQRLFIGGNDITNYLNQLFHERCISFPTPEKRKFLVNIKEKFATVAPSTDHYNDLVNQTDISISNLSLGQEFCLPDGNKIILETEHYRCTEPFFQPQLLGLESPGISKMTVNTVTKCDIDVRRNMYSNILLSGGSTMFSGFSTRLGNEMKHLVPSTVDINIDTPENPEFGTWIGGAVISAINLPTIWCNQDEYLEWGLRNYFYHNN